MLSAEFESDQRETRAELLRYIGHEFPSTPNAQKEVPGGRPLRLASHQPEYLLVRKRYHTSSVHLQRSAGNRLIN
jgi:hypothetical protein